MPTPTAAERLHAQQQKNRKAAGLPDPSEYKKKLDSMKSENYEEDDGPLSQEQLDEISAQLKASYVSGAKKQIKQSMPFTKKTDEYRDIAKNFIAKRQKGIAKANEEVELDESEDKVNARKMYHKHFVAAMKVMPRSDKQRHHQAEMAKYKAMMGDSFVDQVAPKKFAKFDKKTNEEVELLDEMPESSMKTRDVHSHLKKSGWELARSKGGHDVYKHPKAKHSIPVPRHNQLKAPLIRGIMKASKVEESFRIGGMGSRGVNVHMYDRNPGPKDGSELENIPSRPKTELQKRLKAALADFGDKMKKTHPKLREAKDSQEYDYEGDMAKSDLRSIMHHAKELHDMIEDTTNLAEWCQSKITLAEDYLSTVANYMRSEMNEEVKKNEYHIAGKHKFPTKDEHAVTVKHTESGREHVHSGKGKYLSKLIKTRYNINHHFEEVEHNDVEQLDEVNVGDKVSFDHPMTAVPGKTMKKVGTVHKIEGDTAHVKVKDKYGVMTHKKNSSELKKEEVEIDEMIVVKTNKPIGTRVADIGPGGKEYNVKTDKAWDDSKKKQPQGADFAAQRRKERLANSGRMDEGRASQRHPLEGHEYHKKSNDALVHIAKDAHAAAEAMKSHNPQAENKYRDQANDSATVRHFRKTSGMPDWYKKKYGHINESASEPTEGEMKGKQGYSRKAQIVMNAAKGKKSDNPEKFQKDPELSSEIHKT
jgi:predicted RNA binding protein YcfA (HicA-like mRNA interferase family)